MKHIQSINEWFGSKLIDQKKADSKINEFVKNLINIIKTENLYIGFNGVYDKEEFSYIGIFDVTFEDKKYEFENRKKVPCVLRIYNCDKNIPIKGRYAGPYGSVGPVNSPQMSNSYLLDNEIEIGNRSFKIIANLYKKQEKEKKLKRDKEALEKLPDLSDVSRAAKKYNL